MSRFYLPYLEDIQTLISRNIILLETFLFLYERVKYSILFDQYLSLYEEIVF